jgi:hypothetical protein
MTALLALGLVLAFWTVIFSDEAAGIDEDAPDVTEALTAISLACGNLDAACIAVGILEPSAKVPEQTS